MTIDDRVWAVDACTLPTAERPLRLAEFDGLFATAVRGVRALSPTHVRMRLAGPAGLAAQVRDLTARESECCSFFTFTITPDTIAPETGGGRPAGDGEALALDIEVPAEHADVLGSLAQRASAARLTAGAENLGVDGETVIGLAAAWRGGDCPTAHERLTQAVTARLDKVRGDITDVERRMARSGPGTDEWAETTRASVSMFEDAARLQAVAGALAVAPRAGRCGDTCACAEALAAPVTTYQFPTAAGGGEQAPFCDIVADGGDTRDRVAVWQQVLARVERRDPLPDPADASGTGVVLRFPSDADLAATLGRLAVAEYRCCSFGSYTIVVDGAGLRLEIRMPVEAADTMAALVGVPTPAAASAEC